MFVTVTSVVYMALAWLLLFLFPGPLMGVFTSDAQLIAKVKEQYDAHNAAGKTYLFDSVEWFTLQTWNAGDKAADLKLVYTMCENAYDTMTWLHDLGWTYKSDIRRAGFLRDAARILRAGRLHQRAEHRS